MGERKKKDKTDPCTDLMELKASVEKEIAAAEEKREKSKEARDVELGKIGCILDKSVPTSQDEDKDNEIIATWGKIRWFDVP